MTAAQFRRLALELRGVAEGSHQAHPDFRFHNKIFATLGYPDARWGMVKLSPEQQVQVTHKFPSVFRPASGAWGRAGSITLLLSEIASADLRPILRQAYDNLARPARRPRVAR